LKIFLGVIHSSIPPDTYWDPWCVRFPGEIALNKPDPVTDWSGSILKLYLIFQQAALRPPKLPKTLSFALGKNYTTLVGVTLLTRKLCIIMTSQNWT
jgi:hypothetical protein